MSVREIVFARLGNLRDGVVTRLALCAAMVLACVLAAPAAALADTVVCGDFRLTAEGGTLAEGSDYAFEGGVLTIRTADPVTVSMADSDGAATSNRIVVDPGEGATAHVTIDGVAIDASQQDGAAAMEVVSGSLELTLEGGNSLRSGRNRAGLQNGERPLTVSGDGSLEAFGGGYGAGIGGGRGGTSGTGISDGTGSNITISGGTVTATGGDYGAGIGGGSYGEGSNIAVSGGAVTATSGGLGSGIGGGRGGSASIITISGGTATATGGGEGGAGIGGGEGGYASASDISISGGLIDATGGQDAAAIGRGRFGSASNISITGGCFAAGAASEGDRRSVYGIELVYPYVVGGNDDPETAESYPYAVTEAVPELLVSAVEGGDEPVYGEDGDYYYAADGQWPVLYIVGEKPVKVSMADGVQVTSECIVVNPGEGATARVTLDGVSIDASGRDYVAAMLVSSGSLELTLEGGNSLRSGRECAGLQSGERPLAISGEGGLEAAGGWCGAGIGGGSGGSGSNIAVSGGTVTATGGDFGAGIGGGDFGDGSNIAVSGGTVKATGGLLAAGIGGSEEASGSNITISGGAVAATGGEEGSGIGAGRYGSASGITITDGLIDAAGGQNAASIGAGRYGSASDVSITGGRFADGAVSGGDRGSVYGIALAPGYHVVDNLDEGTRERFPYEVVGADLLVSAVDGGGEPAYGEDYYYADFGAVLRIVGGAPMTVSMREGTETTADRIVVDPGDGATAHVTLDGVSIDVSDQGGAAAMEVSSGSLELTLEGKNSLRSGRDCAGLQSGERPLAISGEGSLEAVGGGYGAGIGGARDAAGSNIVISGGIITATGGQYGSGIGGGSYGGGSNIVVSGGAVTAAGGYRAAGIGGGRSGAASNITVSDGSVAATGGEDGSGIGGGRDGSASGISITGGTIDARGGQNAAAIGGGRYGGASNISIAGGLIEAKPGNDAPAMGSGAGYDGPSADVSITGGCFAAGAVSGDARNEIYGIVLTSEYVVEENDDPLTAESYPYMVSMTGPDLLVSAVDGGEAPVYGEGGDYYYALDGQWLVLYIVGTTPMRVSPAEGVQVTSECIVVNPGEDETAHVTLDGVSIDASGRNYVAAMLVSSGSLELTLEGKNSLRSGRDCAGLQSGERPLAISGEGSLEAFGAEGGAGVGGGFGGSGSDIAVSGGTVTATGGDFGAGIGGGYGGSGSDITISGGAVTATGGWYGAGVGGGYGGLGSGIAISGGLVDATGGEGAQAIGGGYLGSSSDVSITGGRFADGSAVLASASDADTRGSVYGIAVPATSEVEGADGYAVVENSDNNTKGDYPVAVVSARVQGLLALAGEASFTYDGEAIEADAFTVSGGTATSFEHKTDDAEAWEQGLPINAGTWQVRAKVELAHAAGYDPTDGLFYFGSDATNGVSVTIGQSGSAIAVDEDRVEQTVVYGETATVSGTVSATGEPAEKNMAARVTSAPTADQVALYYGSDQVSDAASVGEDGRFTLTYDTTDKMVPVGSARDLEVRYVGTDDQDDAAAGVKLTVSPRPVTAFVAGSATKTYDGTTSAPADKLAVELLGTVEGDDLSVVALGYTFDSATAGEEKGVVATGITLGGNDASWYELIADAATGTGLGTIEKAPLTVRALPRTVVFNAALPEISSPTCGRHFELTGFVEGESVDTPGAWSGLPEIGFDDQYVQGATPAGAVLEGAVTVSVGALSSTNYEFAEFIPASLTVLQSATDPGVDEDVETDYIYGDTVVVTGAVAATGELVASEYASDGVAALSIEEPAPGDVALFWRDAEGAETQISDPVTPAADGSYELTYDTAERVVPTGEQTLLVRFVGTASMADAVQELTVTIGRARLTPTIEGTATKPYDGTAAYDGDGAHVTLAGVVGDDEPLASYTLDFEHEDAGAQKLVASNIALAEGEDGWYELAQKTAESLNEGGGITKAAQQAPAGVVAHAQTTAGVNDGSITGVGPGVVGAEWRPADAGDGAWSDVPEGGAVEGLAPGAYEVRYKGDANHEASPATTLTVESFSEAHGGIGYPDGTTEGEGGDLTLPEGGGTVTWPDGTEATLPGGTTVDPDTGVATTPDGTTVRPDGEGGLVVTLPDGTEISAPGGSAVGDGTVTGPDGSAIWPAPEPTPDPEPGPEQQPESAAESDRDELPAAGDASVPAAVAALAGLACVGAGTLLARRRR